VTTFGPAFCTSCGSPLNGAQFCTACGAHAATAVPGIGAPTAAARSGALPAAPSPQGALRLSGTERGLLMGTAAAAVVVATISVTSHGSAYVTAPEASAVVLGIAALGVAAALMLAPALGVRLALLLGFGTLVGAASRSSGTLTRPGTVLMLIGSAALVALSATLWRRTSGGSPRPTVRAVQVALPAVALLIVSGLSGHDRIRVTEMLGNLNPWWAAAILVLVAGAAGSAWAMAPGPAPLRRGWWRAATWLTGLSTAFFALDIAQAGWQNYYFGYYFGGGFFSWTEAGLRAWAVVTCAGCLWLLLAPSTRALLTPLPLRTSDSGLAPDPMSSAVHGLGPAVPTGYVVVPISGASTNGLAVASMVLGILGLAGLGSVLAIIFGHVALSKIKRSGRIQGGRGMAIAGVILGWVGLAGIIIAMIVIFAVPHSITY